LGCLRSSAPLRLCGESQSTDFLFTPTSHQHINTLTLQHPNTSTHLKFHSLHSRYEEVHDQPCQKVGGTADEEHHIVSRFDPSERVEVVEQGAGSLCNKDAAYGSCHSSNTNHGSHGLLGEHVGGGGKDVS